MQSELPVWACVLQHPKATVVKNGADLLWGSPTRDLIRANVRVSFKLTWQDSLHLSSSLLKAYFWAMVFKRKRLKSAEVFLSHPSSLVKWKEEKGGVQPVVYRRQYRCCSVMPSLQIPQIQSSSNSLQISNPPNATASPETPSWGPFRAHYPVFPRGCFCSGPLTRLSLSCWKTARISGNTSQLPLLTPQV